LCGSALKDYALSVLIILSAFTAMLSLRFSESRSGLFPWQPLGGFIKAFVMPFVRDSTKKEVGLQTA